MHLSYRMYNLWGPLSTSIVPPAPASRFFLLTSHLLFHWLLGSKDICELYLLLSLWLKKISSLILHMLFLQASQASQHPTDHTALSMSIQFTITVLKQRFFHFSCFFASNVYMMYVTSDFPKGEMCITYDKKNFLCDLISCFCSKDNSQTFFSNTPAVGCTGIPGIFCSCVTLQRLQISQTNACSLLIGKSHFPLR